MIRKELFKNINDRRNYVEHVKQTNLHPGRNCHYQSGRQRYWDQQDRHERPIQISNPTKYVKCYAELSVQDNLPDQTMTHKFIAEPMSLTAIDTYIAEHNRRNKDFQITDQKLIHRHYDYKDRLIVGSNWFGNTLRHLNGADYRGRIIMTANAPFGTSNYRCSMTIMKDVNTVSSFHDYYDRHQ
jgi:hypothetical protein